MKRTSSRVAQQLALKYDLPYEIIKWRLLHGWPIEHIGAKEFPYADVKGKSKTYQKNSIHPRGAKVRVKRTRKVRLHNHGQRHSSHRPESQRIQTAGTTKTKEGDEK